jgi:hypothetical protein
MPRNNKDFQDGWAKEAAYQTSKAKADDQAARTKYESENPGNSYDDHIESMAESHYERER